MTLSPETLLEEDDDERRERERRTGVIREGLLVICYPVPDDPDFIRKQHRAVCLTRPLPHCPYCPHSRFTLFFDSNPEARFQTVKCPKWEHNGDREKGMSPARYETAELATCESKPFDYCPSCPSQQELVQIGADKQADGWYGRWSRFRKEALEDE